jgi:chromosome partitioning protein
VKVIVVANQKGGVAKTTTAITLAHGLAEYDCPTLLLDLDPQGQAATSLGLAPEPGVYRWLVDGVPLAEVIRPTGRHDLSILPGDSRTIMAQVMLGYQGMVLECLRKRRPELEAAGFQFVIVDTAPSLGGLQEAGLMVSDYVIIPTIVDALGLDSVVRVTRTLRALTSDHGWSGGVLAVLPTFFDDVTTESREGLDQLRTFAGGLCWTPIHRATVLRECSAQGKTVWETAPYSRAALEYKLLLEELYHSAVFSGHADAHNPLAQENTRLVKALYRGAIFSGH